MRFDVAVVGAGFAGALVARVLRKLGRSVVLLERGRHPRFALGESSTPLAALSLRRLAERYELPDLEAFTSHGRWLRAYPRLRRGLKRGFTFYGHRPGEALDGSRRLLVAASPNDELADTHWLREDIDRFLTERAVEEGVGYLDETVIETLELDREGVHLTAVRGEATVAIEAGFLIDASGGALLSRFVPRHFSPAEPTGSDLLFAHLEGVREVADSAAPRAEGWPAGPYDEHRAAVHHLLAEGWAYVLPFDHGVASVGFLLDPRREAGRSARELAARNPDAAWHQLLSTYPSLQASMGAARVVHPITFRPRIRHRLAHAVAERCLCLPSSFAFADPLFSTGIAWSLLGIERVGRLFEEHSRPSAEALARYETLLELEADHIDALIDVAYRSFDVFPLLAAVSMLYFAAASFAETEQRLCPDRRDWPWEGFLGSADPVVTSVLTAASRRLGGVLAESSKTEAVAGFEHWMGRGIEPRNLAGLADAAKQNLYPADVATVVRAAGKLGLTEQVVRERLPLLLR